MSRMQAPVLLVGSLPFDTVEEALRVGGEALGASVPCLPDGEVGSRKNWVGFLATDIFPAHPDLELAHGPAGELTQPDRGGEEVFKEDVQRDENATPAFRVRPGVRELRFDDLGYGRIAQESYRIFRRLRDAGTIAPGVRFQVCLPAPDSAIDAFFDDVRQWPLVHHAYAAALRREIERMLETIPAGDLVIQYDEAWEVVDLAMGDGKYFPFWPDATFDEKLERHVAWLSELWRGVPDETLLGYHWCYGTWGGWPMTAMRDLALCVRLSNEAARRTGRRLDYVHMPVVRHPQDAFFAPLGDLDVGDAKVYLGLVHHTDGVEGFRHRAELARRHLQGLGISSVCGYGRVDPGELVQALRLHRACAEAAPV